MIWWLDPCLTGSLWSFILAAPFSQSIGHLSTSSQMESPEWKNLSRLHPISCPWISLPCIYVACLLAIVPLFVKSWAYWFKWWEIYFIPQMKIHQYISWWMHNARHLQCKSSCLSDKFTSKTVKLEHKVVDLSRRQDLALLLEILSLACKWCWSPTPKHLLTGEPVSLSFWCSGSWLWVSCQRSLLFPLFTQHLICSFSVSSILPLC